METYWHRVGSKETGSQADIHIFFHVIKENFALKYVLENLNCMYVWVRISSIFDEMSVTMITCLIFTSINEILLTEFLSKYCRFYRCHCLFIMFSVLKKKSESFQFTVNILFIPRITCPLCIKRDFPPPFGNIYTQNIMDNAVRC